MPGEPRVIVDSSTASDRDKRIYLATYPAMMKCFEDFDVGFFDLIIADESHRSIYKKFRTLFLSSTRSMVGLTATPVRFIERNTYDLFGCEDQDPTSHFSFDDAINSKPPFLVPFRVMAVSTKFSREGFRYAEMTPEQQAQLEDQDPLAEQVDYDSEDLDKHFFIEIRPDRSGVLSWRNGISRGDPQPRR